MDEKVDKKEDRVRAKRETDSVSSDHASKRTKKNPSYGSQKYWEDRYTSHQVVEKKGTEENLPEAFHSWYFTYEDLSPLLLPLILGDGNDDEHEYDKNTGDEASTVAAEALRVGESPRNTGVEDSQGHSSRRIAEDFTPDRDWHFNSAESRRGDDNGKHERDASDDYNGVYVDNDNGEATLKEYVEFVDEDDVGDGGDTEQPGHREGLSKFGAISVLEIGCGDVPLGRDLARTIESFEVQTAITSNNIIKQVVCVDYAPSCIASLKKEQKNESGQGIQISFEVGDARGLRYKNDSFQLILEKGTMDAMLSDSDEGVNNCKLIVAESARVLATGGYLVVVSHLNAHVHSGLQWLDRIVVPGLRTHCKRTKWEIEVHGNSGDDAPLEAGDDEEQESPGPAVYIIHKIGPDFDATASVLPTIPLKFFSY